jgi:hypothetical protein
MITVLCMALKMLQIKDVPHFATRYMYRVISEILEFQIGTPCGCTIEIKIASPNK